MVIITPVLTGGRVSGFSKGIQEKIGCGKGSLYVPTVMRAVGRKELSRAAGLKILRHLAPFWSLKDRASSWADT